MAILIGFFSISFIFSFLVLLACMRSAQISQAEEWSESYRECEQDASLGQIAPQSAHN